MTETRTYSSPLREQQAGTTRDKILTAAHTLLATKGYARTTIEGIAREGGIAPQTVYAVYKNKRTILAALVERLLPSLEGRYGGVARADSFEEGLRLFAEKVTAAHETEIEGQLLLESLGGLAPEIRELVQQQEAQEKAAQREVLCLLLKGAKFKKGLPLEQVLAIFWYTAKLDSYVLFVRECGWSREAYMQWMCRTLGALVK